MAGVCRQPNRRCSIDVASGGVGRDRFVSNNQAGDNVGWMWVAERRGTSHVPSLASLRKGAR